MKRVRFTRAADRDLDNIWLEIAADNMVAADRFVDGLHELLQKLLQFPSMGAPRDNLLADARSFPSDAILCSTSQWSAAISLSCGSSMADAICNS